MNTGVTKLTVLDGFRHSPFTSSHLRSADHRERHQRKEPAQTTPMANPCSTADTGKQPTTGIANQVNQLIGGIQHILQGLSGEAANDSCLTAELYALKSIYEEIGRVRITLTLHHTALDLLAKDEEREILSIIREALNNCTRHARATHATISIRRRGAKILVQISANGNGLAVEGSRTRGYGVASMKSHAKNIGGNLRIQSKGGRGTSITLEFSLEPLLISV